MWYEETMSGRLAVLVVEDDRAVRESLAACLAAEPDLVPLPCARGREALTVASARRPELALVDLGLPDMPGRDVIRALRERVPACVPVVFTIFDDPPTILGALRAGARGYVLKSMSTERIAALLREAHAGGTPLSPAVARLVVDTMLRGAPEPDTPVLTERETELLELLARGATYQQCAETLGIAIGTVQSYVKAIYVKLDVSSKAEAAVAAMRMGLVR